MPARRARRPSRVDASPRPDDVDDPLTAWWAVNALLHGGASRWSGRRVRRLDEDALETAGLLSAYEEERDSKMLRALASEQADRLAELASKREGTLFDNVERLGRTLDLASAEKEILLLAVTLETRHGLEAAYEGLDLSCARRVYAAVAATLALPVGDVAAALSARGTLPSLGLVGIARQRTRSRGAVPLFEMMNDLDEILVAPHTDDESLLASFFRSAGPSVVQLEDYPHASEDVALASALIAGALRAKERGVNVLLHGPPGSGKTQLVRAIARHLEASLYEVITRDADGDSLCGDRRLTSYQLSQRMLERGGDAVVLFDEVEDVFPNHRMATPLGGIYLSRPTSTKSWLNQTLEENPVPAFWVSNEVRQIDAAILRRFDLVVELGHPPYEVRAAVLRQHLGDTGVSEAWIAETARDERVLPAVGDRLARVAQLTAGAETPVEARLTRALENHLSVSKETRRSGLHARRGLPYDLRYSNADVDLDALIGGLERVGRGTVCMHGPPGTGKTELARHVAERLGRPLLVKRASELLNMYVGESEKALARMFQQAKRERAVLLLDEADSFLRDRRGAVRSWEVTQVNELLTGMEAFEGVLLCATNLVDELDDAAFRRFDVKVRFSALKREQRRELLLALLRDLGSHDTSLPDEVTRELDGMDGLCPGDFAAVRRKAALLGVSARADAVVDALHGEWEHKPDARKAVGFGR